ncbi:hypothetical protein Kpol_1045p41 [Vanderwaltozyma polyspora DSM 70294]|uniref:Ubiquitin carboxyl-terminal hydrolase n=1 Tax=Vanderwaltozyma polyspora (strain ATCC 22028 / DSM 70294 / BCRC 21397 / CBS 2163 / NBRC 10782 / NRRL Y-8283 / UCD 57-17) TaxID=436907 RepID=A7TI48_VANPO|nr:uncharacterized protein Kpol_1045p41 [Vanderwaltozyma polyspora DSM 70294]EDO18055.1 hypothetical protein Kpol_1045p41 [Vanderwaltozyma polyspora DSM 70294]
MFKRLLKKNTLGRKKDTSGTELLKNIAASDGLKESDDFNEAYNVADGCDLNSVPKSMPVNDSSPVFETINTSGVQSLDEPSFINSTLPTSKVDSSLEKSFASEYTHVEKPVFSPTNEENNLDIDIDIHKVYGLENFGNTCYCNSILQCLYNMNEFRENILGLTPSIDAKTAEISSIPNDEMNNRTSPIEDNNVDSSHLENDYTYMKSKDENKNTSNIPVSKFRRPLRISSNVNVNPNGRFPGLNLDEYSDLSSSNEQFIKDGEILQDTNETIPGRDAVKSDPKVIVGRLLKTGEDNGNAPNLPSSSVSEKSIPLQSNQLQKSVTAESNDTFSNAAKILEDRKRRAFNTGPVVRLKYPIKMPEHNLFKGLEDIFRAIAESRTLTGVISPGGFMEIVKKENILFATDMHQDAHEFLNFLLNDVSDYLDKANTEKNPDNTRSGNETNFVNDIFKGTITNQIRCLTCDTVTSRYESFLDFPIEVIGDETIDIQKMMISYHQKEMLQGSNKFYCGTCFELQEAERLLGLKELPKTLAIHLKRFKYSDEHGTNVKLFNKIKYPITLKVSSTFDESVSKDYELGGLVVHIGIGPQHGHYISVCKTSDYGWLLFDDETVECISEDTVLSFVGDSNSAGTAYVLFYKEINSSRNVERSQNEHLENVEKLLAYDDFIRQRMVVSAQAEAIAAQNSVTDVPQDNKNLIKQSKRKSKLFGFKRH